MRPRAGAPVTAIIAYDLEFWRELPFLFPHEDRRPHFEGKPEHSELQAKLDGMTMDWFNKTGDNWRIRADLPYR